MLVGAGIGALLMYLFDQSTGSHRSTSIRLPKVTNTTDLGRDESENTRPQDTRKREHEKRPVLLVTGSSGLIGRRLSERLTETFDVVGFDRPGGLVAPELVDHIPVDLTSAASLNQGLETVRDRYGGCLVSVVHLAAYFDFSGEPNPLYKQVTVEGTQRLVRGLHAYDFQVEQFIFSSTMLVHAPCEPGQTINEDWPLAPRWPYPESKVETEKVIEKERGYIRTAILRIAGVYDDVCHSIPLAHQIQRIYERQVTSRVFPGHISHGQSFMHLDDLVDAFVRTIERRQELPEIVTVLLGEPDVVSYDELQHQFGRLIHDEADWQTRQIPKALAKTGAWVQDMMPLVDDPFIKPWMIDFADDHYALDLGRAKELLGWYPKRSLRDTLPKMVATLKKDPEQWYRKHHLGTQVKAA
jgi:nucleoside-diphosphate-sugar epimerase